MKCGCDMINQKYLKKLISGQCPVPTGAYSSINYLELVAKKKSKYKKRKILYYFFNII